jgi:hypothetical protein
LKENSMSALSNPASPLSRLKWLLRAEGLAHIGFDHALGYGLKSSMGFAYTHLGVIQLRHKC